MKKLFILTLLALSSMHNTMSTTIRSLVREPVTLTIQHSNGCPTEKVTLQGQGSHTSALNCIIDTITVTAPEFVSGLNKITKQKNPRDVNPDIVSINRSGAGEQRAPYVYTIRFEH